MSRTPFLAATVAAALIAAAPAAAAPTLEPERCERGLPKATQCSTLAVPLDRTGATAGTLKLPVRVHRATGGGPKRGPLLLLSGGPGQQGLSPGSYLRRVIDWAGGYDVVEVDQRGTGGTALKCKAFSDEDADAEDADLSPERTTRLFAACADQLGATRRFYTSADSAADIDDLRAALGAEQLTLGGTSYGTWVTQVYARLYPQRTARIVLDSVVGPGGVAGIALSEYAGARRIVAEQCARGACRGITDDPLGDTTRLAARLAERPVRGAVVRPSGKRARQTVGGPAQPGLVMGLLYGGDLEPMVRAAFPAAVASALDGDPALLLRLLASGGGEEEAEDPESFSNALYAASTCGESVLPWSGTDAVAQRQAALDAALAALPTGLLGPWNAEVVRGGTAVAGCLAWPDSPFTGTPAGPLPDVPALVLNGLADVRTPIEDARAVAELLPRATLVPIPNQGHSVLAQSCAQRALRRFLADQPVAGDICARAPKGPVLAPVPPRSLAELAPAGSGRAALARRTAAAVRLTVRDVGSSLALYLGADRFPGLRAGSGRLKFAKSRGVVRLGLRLRGYEYVPGVRVGGTLGIVPLPVYGTLRVRGARAAHGTLVIRDGVARGRLGGVRVAVRVQRARPRAAKASVRASAAALG